MPKITKEDIQAKIFRHVGNRYSIISEYRGIHEPLTIHCNEHDIDFTSEASNFTKSDELRAVCPQCKIEKRSQRYQNNKQNVICAYCGLEFEKSNSRIKKSKSGLFFCCREHKDLAQRLESGDEFEDMRPDHYGQADGFTGYRATAFRHYEHTCAVCDWHEDEDVLEVHHIDANRYNNKVENLIILCPTCHRKLTLHKYVLIGRNQIVKK